MTVQFLDEGISARYSPDEFHNEDFENATKIRKQGARSAMKLLGIDDMRFGTRYCVRFDDHNLIDIVKDVEAVIEEVQPTHIFTHNPIEVNIDHGIAYKAVEAALRPKPGLSVIASYSFEVPCSGNWTFDGQFKPNLYIDIADVWQTKLDAWHCYEGENRPFPFPRSDEGLETLARYRGMQSGLILAEGLKLLRGVF